MQTYNNMNTLFGYFLKIQNKNKTYKMTLKYLNKLSKSKHFLNYHWIPTNDY